MSEQDRRAPRGHVERTIAPATQGRGSGRTASGRTRAGERDPPGEDTDRNMSGDMDLAAAGTSKEIPEVERRTNVGAHNRNNGEG